MLPLSRVRTSILVLASIAALPPLQAQNPQTQGPNTLPSAPAPQPGISNPDAEGIYHIAKEVTVPRLIYSVEPEFSEKARKRKINANITVKFVVNTDGTVRAAHVTKSAADRYTNDKDRAVAATLDPKAIEAVSQYRFEPARFQGKPVPCWLTVDINFQTF